MTKQKTKYSRAQQTTRFPNGYSATVFVGVRKNAIDIASDDCQLPAKTIRLAEGEWRGSMNGEPFTERFGDDIFAAMKWVLSDTMAKE